MSIDQSVRLGRRLAIERSNGSHRVMFYRVYTVFAAVVRTTSLEYSRYGTFGYSYQYVYSPSGSLHYASASECVYVKLCMHAGLGVRAPSWMNLTHTREPPRGPVFHVSVNQ